MADDARIIRIEDKVDRLDQHLGSIDKTLIEQHESLKYHIKRTDLLETAVAPLVTERNERKGSKKLFLSILAIIGTMESIVIVLDFIRHIHG